MASRPELLRALREINGLVAQLSGEIAQAKGAIDRDELDALEKRGIEAQARLEQCRVEWFKVKDEVDKHKGLIKLAKEIQALEYRLGHTNLGSIREEKLVLKQLADLRKKIRSTGVPCSESHLQGLEAEFRCRKAALDEASRVLVDIEQEMDALSGVEKVQQVAELKKDAARIKRELDMEFWRQQERKQKAVEEGIKTRQERREEQIRARLKRDEERKVAEAEAAMKKVSDQLLREAELRHKNWVSSEVIKAQWNEGSSFVAKDADKVIMCDSLIHFLERATSAQMPGLLSRATAKDVQMMLSFEKLQLDARGSAPELLERVKARRKQMRTA